MTQRKGRQSRNEIWREMEGKGKEKRHRAAMEEFCKNIFGRGGGKSFFFFFFFFFVVVGLVVFVLDVYF